MSTEELTRHLLALPLPERVALAEALWQSIDAEPVADPAEEERHAIEDAKRRGEDLTSGRVAGRTHEQVMEAALRILKCG